MSSSSPRDATGAVLRRSAHHPTWSGHPEAEVPTSHYTVPIGKARMAAEGEDCTVIAWGTMVHVCEEAIRQSRVSCDLIDLQSLVPWGQGRSGKLRPEDPGGVIVHEAPQDEWIRRRDGSERPREVFLEP